MVTEDGITKTTFVSREAEFIPFSSVISIHSHRVPGMQGKAGQISRGYFESVLVLEDDKKLLISPDIFENYHEIIEAIRNR
ncbi:hypothetical protein [Flavobacterium foetidum]|uniref:hypothetical protein n=1 Tax=Flavobacterium foetidum TaxID=2026681 RepID=UPI0010758058|nr:hypothetical protein [Flavobacterium foetidum]KAF2516466.1 hypothetical protein E0W73_05080 [Flavobacterium foetidum]